MSTLKVNKLRDTAGSADAITLDPNGGAVLAGVTTMTTARVTSGIVTNTFIVGAGVTISESGIEASGIGITCANINGTQIGGRRNIIINGAMNVAQRGTSFDSTHGIYLLDRFMLEKENNAGAFTTTQSTTSPDGFSKSLKVDCTTADTSTASNEFVSLRYKIEAQDLQHLSFGTSAAKPLVLSFYVRSNVTGTYAVNCLQRDNSSKLYTRNYTIDSADTWERKIISIPADTSGVINDDNGSGLEIYIPLVMGSTYTSGSQSTTAWETFANSKFAAGHAVNILSNTSNEWYLTGMQLEVGSQATDFEHRSYGEELSLCQRYFYGYKPPSSMWRDGYSDTGIYVKGELFFPVTMRAQPTVTLGGAMTHQYNETNNTASETPVTNIYGAASIVRSSQTGRTYSFWTSYSSAGYGFTFNAEL